MDVMSKLIRFTEYLDLDLDKEEWRCHDCGARIAGARENYKVGCLVAERTPSEVHAPIIEGAYTFAPDENWVRILEFYCGGCGRQVETEYLPPGHPITHDIEVDIDSLKRRVASGELVIVDGRLHRAAEA
jgi:acetone carboxylase gamma subunit